MDLLSNLESNLRHHLDGVSSVDLRVLGINCAVHDSEDCLAKGDVLSFSHCCENCLAV